MQNKRFQIAIDGPVGAGKSTVAKLVADKLDIVYIDTGAMYRSVALYMKQVGVEWGDESEVIKELVNVEVKLMCPKGDKKDGRGVTVILNGDDVSWKIREEDMGEGASVVSQYGGVRKKLVAMQREMADGTSVIMEGRDIGTRVLPSATLKIYLDAKPKSRAKRKQEQMEKLGKVISYEEAEQDVTSPG